MSGNAGPGPSAPPLETDALIIGAGPAGLFAAFELGLLGLQAHIVDSLAQPGGQCGELYPDKPIYDIPGLPACTGRELIGQLLRQITPFKTPLHLRQEVSELACRSDGRFDLATSAGTRFTARTVFIAAGVGCFQARRLNVEALVPFEGKQLRYSPVAAAEVAGQQVVVVGGNDAAVRTAVHLAQAEIAPRVQVTLLHRREQLQAEPALLDAFKTLCTAGALAFEIGQIQGGQAIDGRLTLVDVLRSDSTLKTMRADTVLAFLGLSPKLGPLADWGLALERKQLTVDTALFQTSMPGIFAVGDINSYPGKKKLILCGFHEATLAAFAAAQHIFPGRDAPLQYTTTSPALQRALGVVVATPDAR